MRKPRNCLGWLGRLPVLLLCAAYGPWAAATTYLVSTASDDVNSPPAGSLRKAILDANANPGTDTITFGIGSGAVTISPVAALPAITGAVTIDGTSQPGFSGTPLIRIDGNGIAAAGVNGLQVNVSLVAIKALAITRFTGSGIALYAGSGITVTGCYLGTDGTVALGNGGGISVDGANFSTIGGVNANEGNVISGNASAGVYLGPGDALTTTGTVSISLYANRIGTNPAGSAAIANGGYGIRTFAANTVIGNALANSRNIISGNGATGIAIEAGASGTGIYGAYIGVAADGATALANGGDGIADGGSESLIGGTTPGAGNVISGNTNNGLTLFSDGSQVVNNRIGTDATGTAAVPNQYYGIRGYSGGFINIGGTVANAANVISGNGLLGISVESATTFYSVVGNRIGTNLAGTAALPNNGDGIAISGSGATIGAANGANVIAGNTGNGISLTAPAQDVTIRNNLIGLDATGGAKIGNGGYGIRAIGGSGLVIGVPGGGNVISGNARGMILESLVNGATVQGNTIGLSADQGSAIGNGEVGLQIDGANNQVGGSGGAGNLISGNPTAEAIFLYGPDATGNHIEGNVIGTDGALVKNFGNYFGVVIYGASGNFIGGTAAGAGNIITNTTNIGIYDWFGSQNRFLGNSIHDNGGLGIDLQPQGPLPNDPFDIDHGANEGQNYPIVTHATPGANSIQVEGTLNSEPSTSFRVEYFVSIICDPSGIGEGANYIGFENTDSDANGVALLGATIPTALTEGYLTATATSASGNTSEFSPCIAIGSASAGEFNIAQDPLLAYEDLQATQVAVVRSQGLNGAVSVRIKTSDGTATAPGDYAAIDQILNFADGESIKIVDVPIVLDNTVEPAKQFGVALSQATGGAFLGAQASVTVDLFDHDPATPFYLAGDASTPEPPSGQVQVNVPVRLSAATNHTVTLTWSTQDGSAKAGQDYVAASGQLVFAPGEALKYVPLTVTADGPLASDRVFYLIVGAVGQQVIAGDSEGEIVIFGGDTIFRNGFQ